MNTRFKSLDKYTDARTAYRLAHSVIREFSHQPVSKVTSEQLSRVIEARKVLDALEMLTSNCEGWEEYLVTEARVQGRKSKVNRLWLTILRSRVAFQRSHMEGKS